MAIQIVREVNADVVKRGATRAVYAKQNDYNSRFLNVHIQEDGKDIAIDSEADIILSVERPDKQENMFYGTINDDGTVKVPLAPWMLELEGTLSCDISIVQEGVAKLTTMQFNIYVEEAVVTDESFIESEEYSVIVDLLKRTNEAAEIASEAANNATTLKTNCEAATLRANEAAQDASKVREEVENGGFIESIKEMNKGVKLSFWVGTPSEYNALENKENNCFYITTGENVIYESSEGIKPKDDTSGESGIIPLDITLLDKYSIFAVTLGGSWSDMNDDPGEGYDVVICTKAYSNYYGEMNTLFPKKAIDIAGSKSAVNSNDANNFTLVRISYNTNVDTDNCIVYTAGDFNHPDRAKATAWITSKVVKIVGIM